MPREWKSLGIILELFFQLWLYVYCFFENKMCKRTMLDTHISLLTKNQWSSAKALKQYLVWDVDAIEEEHDTTMSQFFRAIDDAEDEENGKTKPKKKDKKKKSKKVKNKKQKKRKGSSSSSVSSASSSPSSDSSSSKSSKVRFIYIVCVCRFKSFF